MSLRAFILAGGLGTRLSPISGDTPKALMPIAGQPFVRRLVDRLVGQRISDIVLCLGHRAESIREYFLLHPVPDAKLRFSIESVPRGTAGALRVAERYWQAHNLLMNGDTEVHCDFSRFISTHAASGALVTVGLAQVRDAARFGRVDCDPEGWVRAFQEKDGTASPGLVNVGLYAAARAALQAIPEEGVYSIERDWLPDLVHRGERVAGLVVADGFTDIGTPEDYWRLANHT